MANGRRDVQLVIRAKDEAARAINGVADALGLLFSKQEQVASGAKGVQSDLAQVGQAILDVERAYNTINPAADRAAAAFDKQNASLSETRAQLDAVESQITGAGRAIAKIQRDIVETTLQGGDTSGQIAQLKAAEAALTGLEGQQRRLTTSINAQESALGKSRSELQQLSSVANTAEAALASMGNEAQQAAAKAAAAAERQTQAYKEQAREARDLADAQRALQSFDAFIGVTPDPGGASAQQSAEVFQELARQGDNVAESMLLASRSEAQMAAAAKRLKEEMDPLVAVQNRLNAELADARALYKAGKLSAQELAEAEELLALKANNAAQALERQGRGANGAPSLFGLKPYELQNLSFQVNDVVTQLASGTSISQTLAQQGGQILQLFPRIGGALIGALANPVVLAGVAAIGTLGISIKRAADESSRLRGFESLLEGMADGARYSAVELTEVSQTLDRIGLSAEESTEAVGRLVREGIRQERIEDFGRAARDLADVLGVDVSEATDRVAESFTRGYEAISDLNDATNFLTAAEAEHIQSLFDQGRAAEARNEAFAIFRRQMDTQAARARGPWTSAFRSLATGLDGFIDRLSDTQPVRRFIRFMDDAALGVEALGRALDGVRDKFDVAREIASIDQTIRSLGGAEEIQGTAYGDRLIADRRRLISELRQLEREQREGLDATGDITDEESERNQERLNQVRREIRLENEAEEAQRRLARAESDAQRAAAEANAVRIAGERAYREEIERTGNTLIARERRTAAEASERRRFEDQAFERQRRDRERGVIQLQAPVAGGYRTSSFGYRQDPNGRGRRFHTGVDIGTPVGTPVLARADGVVEAAGLRGGYGNTITIDFGGGTTSLDAHLSRILVEAGERVAAGQIIGYSGGARGAPGAGNSTGPHLHHEIRRNDRPVDPFQNGGRFEVSLADAYADAERAEERRLERQADYNERIDDENERRRITAANMQRLLSMSGEQLHEEERRQAVQEAVLDAQREASRSDLELSEERRAAIEATVAAEFDVLRARERATAAVDENSGERTALIERIRLAQELGDVDLVAELTDQLGVVDNALRRAIESAIEFWQQFDTPEARTAIAGLQTLGAGLEREAAELRRQPLQDEFDGLSTQRGGLMEQIEFFRNLGQMNVAEELRDQLRQVDEQILIVIDDLLAMWATSDSPEAANMMLQLQNMRNQIVAAQNEFSIAAGQIQQSFANAAAGGLDTFARTLVETRNPLKALADGALDFAAQFLQAIGQILLQMAALRLAMSIGFGGFANVLNGGGNNGIISAIAGGVFHGGGIAGNAQRTRMVSPAAFANAVRYHGGGIAGFAPDEVPAILRRNEEILEESDPRHRFNIGKSGSEGANPIPLRQVLAFGDDEVAGAMSGPAGERVILTHLRRNSTLVRQLIDGG